MSISPSSAHLWGYRYMVNPPTVTKSTEWKWPVDKQGMREHAMGDSSDDDDFIRYTQSAQDYLESVYGVIFGSAAAVWELPAFPVWLQFWYAPFVQLDSITYTDLDGTQKTFDITKFYVYPSKDGAFAHMLLRDETEAVEVSAQPDAVKVNYTAGWANANVTPQRVQQAVRMLATHYMETRPDSTTVLPRPVHMGVKHLMVSYRAGAMSGQLQESVRFYDQVPRW